MYLYFIYEYTHLFTYLFTHTHTNTHTYLYPGQPRGARQMHTRCWDLCIARDPLRRLRVQRCITRRLLNSCLLTVRLLAIWVSIYYVCVCVCV